MAIVPRDANQNGAFGHARFGFFTAGRRSTSVRLARFVLFSCLLFLPGPRLCGQDPIVRQLAPGVFYYWGDELQQKSANCIWVVFKDYVLAVDANYPWGAQEILTEIKKTTGKPVRFLFDTHYHDDHTMGNSVFVDVGATIVSSAETAKELRGASRAAWDRRVGPSGHSLKEFRPEYPSLVFDDKLVFDDGEHRVELIRMGPAHTRGDAVAYLPKEKILATGDLFVNGNPWGNNVADTNADYDKWLQVLDTMAGWDVTMVVPGHGNIGTTAALKRQGAFLADMLEQVRAGIRAGRTADQLVKEIDLTKHKPWGPNTTSNERSIRAMYRKLAGTAPRVP
jgi:glyoxylase-like metal-dependent hydrolase (beta-lactamase superfamily II)